MPPVYRIIEVALYSLLNFLPYILLALYPFKKQFRFSRPVTYILVVVASVVQIALGCFSAFSPIGAGALSAISTVIYIGFYFLVIRAHFGKILFTLLMLSNVTNFIVSSSKCVEGLIAPDLALQDYRWTFSAVMIVMELVWLVPLFFYIKKTFTHVFESPQSRPIWRYIWLIPATFYFIWYYHLYVGSHGSSLELALKPSHSIFLLIVNLGAILIYHVTVRLIIIMERNDELSDTNHQLAMQNLQHENLQERIAEARVAKHDIRHHITVLDGYAENGDLVKLREYLASYKKSLPDDRSIVFCKNHAVNTILLYFCQQAKNNDIDFDLSKPDLPESIGIPDTEISVILGNLLENAIDACAAVPDVRKRKITLRSSYAQGGLYLTISNSFAGEVKQDKNGSYVSTKHKGHAYGLSSVRNVVNRYGGKLNISHDDGIFRVELFMNTQMKIFV